VNRLGAIARISFWAIALTAFVCFGLLRLSRFTSAHTIQFCGPFHSTDHFFFSDTGRPNASEKLVALFESTPASEPVLIFTRNDDRRSGFIGMMIAYLAWPHPVRVIDVLERQTSGDRASDFPASAVWIFCRVEPPPSFRDGERLGDTVQIFTSAGLVER
jgi:hypothetical protein